MREEEWARQDREAMARMQAARDQAHAEVQLVQAQALREEKAGAQTAVPLVANDLKRGQHEDLPTAQAGETEQNVVVEAVKAVKLGGEAGMRPAMSASGTTGMGVAVVATAAQQQEEQQEQQGISTGVQGRATHGEAR